MHRLRHFDRRAGERAGDAKLVEVDGELLRTGEHDHGRAADHDRDRHRLAPLAIFEPVQIAAGPARLARHHAHDQPVGRFERRPIGAHVLDAGIGITGDAERGRQIGRGVEAGRRDRHRQARQATRRLEGVAREHDLLAARRIDGDRRNGTVDGPHPGFADLVDRLPHADGIDLGRGRERADHDRNIVATALGVRHIGKQEGAPLVLGNAAQELPTHQRMKFGILVDGAVDANQQTLRLKIGQMILKIEARAVVQPTAMRGGRLIEHLGSGFHPTCLRRAYHDPSAPPSATRSPPPDALPSSAVDLKFLSFAPQSRLGTSNPKTALE